MTSLNILYSEPHNFLKEVTQKKKKEGKKHAHKKMFVVHQKFLKIFHEPLIFA